MLLVIFHGIGLVKRTEDQQDESHVNPSSRFSRVKAQHKCLIKSRGFLEPIEAVEVPSLSLKVKAEQGTSMGLKNPSLSALHTYIIAEQAISDQMVTIFLKGPTFYQTFSCIYT